MKIYCNTNWHEDDRDFLRESVSKLGHRIDFAPASGAPSAAGVSFAKSAATPDDIYDIAFGQPSVEWILSSRRLRWIHISSAGYTRYDRPEVRAHLRDNKIVFTNASSILADPVAQHAFALMMSAARRLPTFHDAQSSGKWAASDNRPSLRVLDHTQRVLIVGFGAIGARLAELLSPMNVDVVGVRNRPRGDEAVPVVSIDQLDVELSRADHIVNLLPASDSTKEIFNATRFAQMKRMAIFYNVGRGSTVDQEALQSALDSKRLAAAFLDVTTPEPLPAEHPLWHTPNCHITPHIAGAMQDAARRQTVHFIGNLQSFATGQPLASRVFD